MFVSINDIMDIVGICLACFSIGYAQSKSIAFDFGVRA